MVMTTPETDGFAMPAEWEPHSRCYISWPCKESTWHGYFARTKSAYRQVIEAISRFEPVTVLATRRTIDEARTVLREGTDILEMELDDSWLRDNGPIFVKDGDSRVAIVKFGFNAWGDKFPPFDKDELVPIHLAKHLRMRCYSAPLILEGGSISVDGEGTLLTTEQCLLNKNRNPDLTRRHIERRLGEFLGVKKVIWLGRGVEDDVTDGHVDGVASFAGRGVVIAAHTKDASDPNHAALEDNIARLESATDFKGRSIEVIRITQPRPRDVSGIHITPCYTNHYIANGGVVAPTYGIKEDASALDTLRSAYPNREIAGVNCIHIEVGGGAVHCITQQMPAGVPALQ